MSEISSNVAVICFPLWRRRAKVVDVALKLSRQKTDLQRKAYRGLVTGALVASMGRIGIPGVETQLQIDRFWRAVDLEVARQLFRNTGGECLD